MPLNHHAGQRLARLRQVRRSSAAVCSSRPSFYSHRALWHLILGGVFERFPKLKFVVTEQGASWVPGTLADDRRLPRADGVAGESASSSTPTTSGCRSSRASTSPATAGSGPSFPSPREAATRTRSASTGSCGAATTRTTRARTRTRREALRRSFAGTDPVELQQLLAGNAARVLRLRPRRARADRRPRRTDRRRDRRAARYRPRRLQQPRVHAPVAERCPPTSRSPTR